MFVVLVSYQGKEMYRRLFNRQSDAWNWYTWRCRILKEGLARNPGDTVALSVKGGNVLAVQGDQKDVRTS